MSNPFNHNPRGNPNLGRESKKALKSRTHKWRRYNDVWITKALVDRSDRELRSALPEYVDRLRTPGEAHGMEDMLCLLDSYDRGSNL